jgi:palmitoyl-protein thioesterase
MEQKNYLPIILVSGISADQDGMKPMIQMIKEHLSPEVYVKHIVIGLGKITSFYNILDQAAELALAVSDDPKLAHGFNIIAHSQGGLVVRCLIQHYNFPIHNYIALGSPQRGICGIPDDSVCTPLEYIEPYVSSVLYTSLCQAYISFAGYWNDSLKHNEYLEKCSILPYLNNEKEHEKYNQFKDRITRLQNMVLVKSSQEFVVEPAISCHFGFYKQGSTQEVEELYESEIYKHDKLGLKILHKANRLHLKEADCYHTDFESDEKNFIKNVLPFLQLDKDEKLVAAVKREHDNTCYIDITY